MADTNKSVEVHSPYVNIRVSEYGRVKAEVQVIRDKRGGEAEYLTLTLDNLDVNELRCIALQSMRALNEKRHADWRIGSSAISVAKAAGERSL